MDIENLPRLEPKNFGELEDPDRPVLSALFDAKGPHRVGGHQHPRAQILYLTRGVCRVATSLGTWVVPHNQAIWIPPHVYHEVFSNDSADFLLLFIDEAYTDRLPAECVVINVSPFLHELFFKSVAIGNDYPRDGKQTRFVRVLLDELGDMQPAPFHLPVARDRRVRRVMELLLEHPDDRRSLEDFAAITGASVRNLARLFKRETGMNFGEWRKQLLLTEALDRLGQGQALTRVALELGYSSNSAFIAMFRRTVGMPPGQYFSRQARN